jgi:outer membrane protein assembly factor BamD
MMKSLWIAKTGLTAQQAQLEVAYAYYKSNEPASAIAACDRFIKLHPNHPAVDYVYYLKGLINFNEDLGYAGYISSQDPSERDPKAAREAFDTFRELVKRFPDSKYTPDALKRMEYLVNALASLEVHVARYYLKRGAPLAAANRAQTAIKTYPQAPANEEALYIMVKAYDTLGMTDLRDDADRVLKKNYPNSRFYAQGLEEKKPWWKLW